MPVHVNVCISKNMYAHLYKSIPLCDYICLCMLMYSYVLLYVHVCTGMYMHNYI